MVGTISVRHFEVTQCRHSATKMKRESQPNPIPSAVETIEQTWATYGPRAGSGPRDHFTRPAGTYKNMTLYPESSRTSFTLL